MAKISLTQGRGDATRTAGLSIIRTKTQVPHILSNKNVHKFDRNSFLGHYPTRTITGASGVVSVQAPEREIAENNIPRRVEWFNKNKELWVEPLTVDELDAAIKSEPEKFVFVDFYAGWCSSCKAAYPALCRIAQNDDFRKKFKFVKVDVGRSGISSYIRELGIRGIPTIVVFGPGGEKAAQFGGSFRRMNTVKANLVVMGANFGSDFVTDPNGFVLPRPE